MARVLVVGAGVIGLSCAVRLLEAGHEVAVVARDLPLETTSAVAAALWYPYLAHPPDRVDAWARTTYVELARLATDPDTGVAMVPGTELLREPAPLPAFLAAVPGAGTTPDVPPGYASGWTFLSPVLDIPTYLEWLAGRVGALGGTVTRMALAGLPDRAEVVVDAAGLGARLLAQDTSVVPVRGQVLYVEQVGLERWVLDDAGPTYVVPRRRDIVVGGTEDHGAWDRTPDPRTADELLRRAVALVPELARARVLGHRVGLRPARPAVRLEQEHTPAGTRVVHCYGHGGAGVTLSWGCAAEVAALVGGP